MRDNKWELTEDDYLELVKRKTANYTITRPLRVGAIIAGANKKQVDSFNKLGEKLGIAFQIQDDLLNLVAEEKAYGKEIAGDLYEGKRTLVLIHLLSKLKGEEKQKVLSAMGKKRGEKTKEEMDFVLGLLHQKGSIDYGKKISLKYAQEARELFDKKFAFLPDSQAKQNIVELIDFIVNREY